MKLSTLPVTHRAVIPEEYLDDMGHMNVMWYVHLFDRATWSFFESVGMGQAYYTSQDTGAFALEQHNRYLAEVRQGQAITIRSRLLGRSTKRFHFMHFMTADDSGIMAATTEIVGIHIDCLTRRSSPLPDDIAATLDRLLAEHNLLDWEPPACGVMRA